MLFASGSMFDRFHNGEDILLVALAFRSFTHCIVVVSWFLCQHQIESNILMEQLARMIYPEDSFFLLFYVPRDYGSQPHLRVGLFLNLVHILHCLTGKCAWLYPITGDLLYTEEKKLAIPVEIAEMLYPRQTNPSAMSEDNLSLSTVGSPQLRMA